MFKFKFSDDENDFQDDQCSSKSDYEWIPAEEVIPDYENSLELIRLLPSSEKMSFSYSEACKLYYIKPQTAIKWSSSTSNDNCVAAAESSHSDLIPSKYEGGFKIWECTNDLIKYIKSDLKINFNGKTVLDLGCGSGLVGIVALLDGAEVHFQDYVHSYLLVRLVDHLENDSLLQIFPLWNETVLRWMTIPNVLLNAHSNEERVFSRCRFFAGDWESFAKLKNCEDLKYDFILTSETIYNVHNHAKLYAVMQKKMKKNGIAYLAAKTYYFGVGGGIRKFESLLLNHGLMKPNVCWTYTTGVQREILRITF